VKVAYNIEAMFPFVIRQYTFVLGKVKLNLCLLCIRVHTKNESFLFNFSCEVEQLYGEYLKRLDIQPPLCMSRQTGKTTTHFFKGLSFIINREIGILRQTLSNTFNNYSYLLHARVLCKSGTKHHTSCLHHMNLKRTTS
jgi:hypothetical protein